MELESITTQPTLSVPRAGSFAELGSEEFLELLITQLTNQDPLEPMGNVELLEQLSSVRDLELSTTLTDTLRQLAGQDRFSSSSALIGKYVTSAPGADGLRQSGVVLGVRFTEKDGPLLQLSDGTELPVERLLTVEAPREAAEALVGRHVTGIDRRRLLEPELVEGVVTAVREEPGAELYLELDNGKELRFRDVISAVSPT